MQIPEKKSRPFDALGLGEVMLRLSPPDKERISMGEAFEKTVGGSELNVMCGVSLLGLRTGIITKLPNNSLGTFVRHRVRFAGVSDDHVIYDQEQDGRLGIYYYEFGAHPRKPSVIYDRRNSSFTCLKRSELSQELYSSTRAFHVSGITLGLGEQSHKLAIELIKGFKEAGAMISFDVNYRAALWGEETAYAAMQEVLPYVDVLFASEETSRRMLRRKGTVEEMLRGYHEQYGMDLIAMTRRTVESPTRHSWDSILYDAKFDDFFSEAPYEDIEVVDRIGSGDAYLAGVLSGLLMGKDYESSMQTGNAMAAIKNTVMGDMPASSWSEISAVIAAHHGEVQSEMNR